MNIVVMPYSHQIGSTHVLVNMGRYLQERGHNVVIVGDGPFMSFAKESGLKTDYLEEIPIDYYREKTDAGKLDYFSEDEIKDNIQKETALYKKYKADLVLSTLRFTSNLSTEKYGIPNIALTYSVLTEHYALPFIVPETHSLHKYHKCPPIMFVLNKLSGPIKKMIFTGFVKPYNKIAQELGISTYKTFSNLYEGDHTLLFDVPEFAPVKGEPETYHYIGTVFNNISSVAPHWYEEVKKLRKTEGKQVVYLSMGSSGVLFPKIFDFLSDYIKKRNMLLIASSCNHEVKEKYSDRKDIFLIEFASAQSMLELSDIVLAHGGRGTMFDSITMEVPMVIIPHQAEQEWNARRAVDLGFAEMVSKVHFNEDLLERALDKILEEYDSYKRNVITMKSSFDRFDWKKVLDSIISSYC